MSDARWRETSAQAPPYLGDPLLRTTASAFEQYCFAAPRCLGDRFHHSGAGRVAQGLPNKTVAYDLGISSPTVEVDRANLMAKLHVHSLPDALRIAFAAGMGDKDLTAINSGVFLRWSGRARIRR